MNRLIFFLVTVGVIFGFSRCAKIKPEDTKYHSILVAELSRMNKEENFLCTDLYPVEEFPYMAKINGSNYSGDFESENVKAPPEDPLGVKWRDLVAVNLVRESERIDFDSKVVGYDYELTAKGRELYSQRTLSSGKKRAFFCLGKPVIKQIAEIRKRGYSIQGLDLIVRYTLKLESGGRYLYDGTAKALGLKVPTRENSGEIVFPETNAVVILQRHTDKVLSWEPM